ncbi:MAG: UDP-N-acetylmuramoyl-L-alanyl-D-glutamate--2,6-diaminopimelate ligase [Acidobacteriota bacterium]|nr:UDP-N-acetylmuramoyl-L-alanyl-D-glutamate--2,6-diaminopimelate ligase [Acidobacteriota bacterium]
MDLLAVLPDAEIDRTAPEAEVSGVSHDSRTVSPGDLFVAIRGAKSDGAAHIPEAIARGAVAVASENPAPPGATVAWARVPNARRALALAAAELAGNPADRLVLAGVTGTNGKTTTATLLSALLERRYGRAGFLGTVGYRTGRRETEASRTTPDAAELQRLLAEMVENGVPAAAIEVSSHALALDRVAGCRFDVAVFTNLTRDHLDFHADMEEYFAAKAALFSLRKPGAAAVINVDDPWGFRLASSAALPVVTTSSRGAEADVRAEGIRCDLAGTSFDLVRRSAAPLRLSSPLLGRFNADNLLSAAAAGLALGLSDEQVMEGCASVARVPGRLEPVEAGQPYRILVDYAHTPDALERLLLAVRELTDRKIVLVFGCGGDRDRGKRFPMGEIAGRLADIPIATSDNPRSEDPNAILADVAAGLAASGATKALRIADRREAIRAAIDLANSGTVVVLAGKGHETTQVIGSEELPFDDRKVAAELAAERR